MYRELRVRRVAERTYSENQQIYGVRTSAEILYKQHRIAAQQQNQQRLQLPLVRKKVPSESDILLRKHELRAALRELPTNTYRCSKPYQEKIPIITINGGGGCGRNAIQSHSNLVYKKPVYSQSQYVRPVNRRSCDEAGTSAGLTYATSKRYIPSDNDCFYDYDDVFVDTHTNIPSNKKQNDRYAQPMITDAEFRKRRSNADIVKLRWMFSDIYNREYLKDIIDYLLENELRFYVAKEKVAAKPTSHRARECTVDWMVYAQVQYCISSDAYLQAIRIFDYFLFNTNVLSKMYQLVAIVCLWITSKYDNDNNLRLETILRLLGRGCTREELLDMETAILGFIRFNCNIPEPTPFVEYYLKIMNLDNKYMRIGSYYLLESFALWPYFSTIQPSHVAISVVYLTIKYLGENIDIWRQVFRSKDYYPIEYIEKALKQILSETYPYKKCYEKYLTEQYSFIPNAFARLTI